MAEHMTKSEKKYGKYNWARGQEVHTPLDSGFRYLLAFLSGEDIDEESGSEHLISAACNLMIAWTSMKLNDKDLDTRWKWKSM
jgi:hypothetical protein